MSAISRASGTTPLALALTAARAALAEAGLEKPDAILSYHLNDSAPVLYVARALGMAEIGWHNEIYGGGTQCASILGDAAMLVASGVARSVLVYRALNGRSGQRMNALGLKLGEGAEEQFTHPYGMAGPVHQFALAAQRYLHDRGLTETHLSSVVRRSRSNALANPRALVRKPMSHAEYLAEPVIAAPLRRADCCQETDAACALVVTAPRPGAPLIRAVVRGGGPGCSTMDRAEDVTRLSGHYLAEPLYAAAGMKPSDVDVALLYDAYSWLVPRQLEDYGLLAREDLADGLDEALARVNPHGGLLSEGYVHGLNNTAEAVRQVRAGSGPALVTGFGGSYGSAALLTPA
ncbi:acetyl-CoA acetyltransferase [Actinocorallia sp. API 0066]|uniref:thiolase C-terminal domain-containing protein n=1 Tax=Actinocorallia sp. API 0066 TaxID=2896846 RepID=UPI001E2C1F0E|nr:acetyl-CoA acetyltransferase [Actinocorallia sp. API 0066]MCD0453775.1 acetyl-CoA acetyltransferase [Actinocorallia sp. API 0066]